MTRNKKAARRSRPSGEFKENDMERHCIIPQKQSGSNYSLAFLIEALLACESLWAVLPQPAPLFAQELISALEIAERVEVPEHGR